ncbi:MAG: GFA family protein [Hyphomonadaceae bacterium]
MARGECNCGAVAFETSAPLDDVFVCHCSICRRFTGANGIAVVVVPNETFRWLRGQDRISTWKKPGADWQGWFCAICGSAVPGANDAERTYIPAGLIDEGGERMRVAHHIWVGSKAGWDDIGGAGKLHQEAFKAD